MTPITVVVMTYNQANYIEKALDSILSQKINVDFDILVHDDHSDDGTYEVLLDYQKKSKVPIRIIEQESRKFLAIGFNLMIYRYVVPQIQSQYVAYCDGDDYWCDEQKLQKQYDYMTAHPDCSLCFHSAYQLREGNDLSSKWFIAEEGDIDMTDLVNDKPGICIATSSVFLKSGVFGDFSDWRKAYPVEDVPMYMTAALHGKIHRLPDIMCVYRQFAVGSWSTQNKGNNERKIRHLNELKKATVLFNEQTDRKYEELVCQQIESCDFRIAMINKDFKTVFDKKNKRFVKRMGFRERTSLVFQYRFKHLYHLIKKGESLKKG